MNVSRVELTNAKVFLLFKCNVLGAFYMQYAFGGCQV